MTTIVKINKPGCNHYEVLDDKSQVVDVMHKTELEATEPVEKTLSDYREEAKIEYSKIAGGAVETIKAPVVIAIK